MESCHTLCWDGCVTWLRRVFVGHVGYCWHGIVVSSSLVNVTFRKGNRSLHVMVACWWRGVQALVRQRFRSLCFCLEYAVLDDKATSWFFHYIRCYSRVMWQSMTWYALRPSRGRGTRRQTSGWSGHKRVSAIGFRIDRAEFVNSYVALRNVRKALVRNSEVGKTVLCVSIFCLFGQLALRARCGVDHHSDFHSNVVYHHYYYHHHHHRDGQLVETDFGQTDFGHRYPTDFGQTDFGQTDFGQS